MLALVDNANKRKNMAGKMICVTGASLASLRSWLVKSLLDPGYRVRGTVCNPGGGCVVYEKGPGQGSQIWKGLFSDPSAT